jgi:hypothetical protein
MRGKKLQAGVHAFGEVGGVLIVAAVFYGDALRKA